MPPRNAASRVPSGGSGTPSLNTGGSLDVQLPGGGTMRLLTLAEVKVFNEIVTRYKADYRLTKQNDLVILGGLVTQQVFMHRFQQMADDPDQTATALSGISKCMDEIRKAEIALALDRKSRERDGGQQDVADYVSRLKKAAHERGVHLSERYKAYELFVNELKWRVHLNLNGDDEDRRYHRVQTPKEVLLWADAELKKLELADKKFANDKGAIWVGRL